MRIERIRSVSSTTASAFLGAAAFAVLTAGTAVAVSTTAVSITNPSTGTVAHVTGKQSLVTSERDPSTGAYAKVDAAGRQLVGEGIPSTTWVGAANGFLELGVTTQSTSIAVPPSGRLAVRGISVTVDVPAGQNVKAHIAYTDRNGTWADFAVPLVMQGNFGSDTVVSTMPIDVYPKSSSSVTVWVTRSSDTGTGTFRLTASGELF
jgi:hypothetical protein